MNATPMNLNPSHALRAQATGGKQQETASAETPFSQVLSSEMAQNRHASSATQDSPASGPDAPSQADGPVQASAGSTSSTPENPSNASTEKDEIATDLPALPLSEEAANVPQALLALGLSPDSLKPAPDKITGELAEEPSTLSDRPFLPQDARNGKARLAEQVEQADLRTQKMTAKEAPGTGKADPALPSGAADARTEKAAALSPAFAGQLAAARQAEAVKTREFMSELSNNPALRPSAQPALESLATPMEAASPRLAPTVGTPAWNQALGDKIVWMAAGAQQSATLTLNPPNMGPLQVVLNVSNEQATASFFSAQPEVRQALEAAFPRLREMMNEAGIQLGQATVSADTPQQHHASDREAQRAAPPFPGAGEAITAGVQPLHTSTLQSGRGLVDTFA